MQMASRKVLILYTTLVLLLLKSPVVTCKESQLSPCLCSYESNLLISSLDLMSSPNNPPNHNMLERTAATYFIIHLVNNLFMSSNDVIELGWLEREFYATNKSKWDGVLFKFGNKSCSLGLIEFSGGFNDKTPSSKSQHDIAKLYSKLLSILKKHPSNTTEQAFCIGYYDNYIYFEKLTTFNGAMFRSTHAKVEAPSTPRKLVEFVKEAPKILAWKQAVINRALESN